MPALDTFIVIVALFGAALCAIFDVARRVSFEPPIRKLIYELIALTILSAAAGACAFWMGSQMRTVSTGMDEYTSSPNAEKLKQATPEKLAEVTRHMASRDYLWLGVLSEHTTADGTRVLFQPSPDELKTREQYVVDKTSLQLIGQVFTNWAYAFWTMPVLAAGLGFLIGRRKRTAHKGVD
jgi:hypothetical protein